MLELLRKRNKEVEFMESFFNAFYVYFIEIINPCVDTIANYATLL